MAAHATINALAAIKCNHHRQRADFDRDAPARLAKALEHARYATGEETARRHIATAAPGIPAIKCPSKSKSNASP